MNTCLDIEIESETLMQLKNSCFDNVELMEKLINNLIKNALQNEKASILVD